MMQRAGGLVVCGLLVGLLAPAPVPGQEPTTAYPALTLQKDAYVELAGFGATAADNQVVVTNERTGASVTVRGDRPLSAFHVWSAPTTVCPEPFIAVGVAPGAERTWRIDFTFGEAKP